MKTKLCKKCGRNLPLNAIYYFKDKKRKDGFWSSCKECNGHKFVEQFKNYTNNGYKICTICHKKLPATSNFFHKQKLGSYGLRSYCKECSKIKTKELWKSSKYRKYISNYKKINSDKIKKYCRIYREINKKHIREVARKYEILNKESISKRKKEYRKINIEKIQQKSKLYYISNKEKIAEYRKNNKEKYQVIRARRKKRLKNTINTFIEKDWKECLDFFDCKDAYTGLPMKITSQDHIVPVSKGGGFTRQNIVPCEASINSSKHNNDMETWYRQQPFFSEERLQKIYKWIGVKDNIQQLKIL